MDASFAPGDSARADELATLAHGAASFYARELRVDTLLHSAVFARRDWFSEFPAVPSAAPWAAMPHRLVFMPVLLRTGILIRGDNELDDRRRVDFVMTMRIQRRGE